MPEWRPSSDELSLESGIQAAYEATVKASTHECQRQAFRLLADLCAKRSPEMVKFLEQQRGIG